MYKLLFIVLSFVSVVVISLVLTDSVNLKQQHEWKQTSQKNIYDSKFKCENPITTGSFQQCSLKLFQAGKVVKNAKLFVKGGMLGHAHGLPSSPRLLWSEDHKSYLIEGLKFSMPGQWLLRFNLNADDAALKDIIELTIEVN